MKQSNCILRGLGWMGAAALSAGFAFAVESDPFAWGGLERHPAVVNPVLGQDAAAVISLRGAWEFTTTCRNLPTRNGLWGFFPDEDWKDVRTVSVPGCWEAQGVGEPGMGECWVPTWDENSKPIRHKHMGEGWYRRTVRIPSDWSGKRVWIKLGGAKSVAWVWVNSHQVAYLDDYCGTYKFEITDFVEPGKDAKVVIEVDNRKPSRKGLMSAMHKWGGLYRDVELEATPETFIDDAWVRGDFDRRSAEVHVTVAAGRARSPSAPQGKDQEKKIGVENRCTADGSNPGLILRATVEGETVDFPNPTIQQSNNPTIIEVPLRNFRAWSPEHPNLYTAKVELVSADGRVLQTRLERFGVRKIEVVGREFRLNGKPLYLRGFGDDHVYPLTGLTAADVNVHRAHLAKARAAGFNFTRLHTHCEVPEYFEAADELGVMIQAELPYYSDVQTEAASFDPKRDVTELYEHYRRHPSFLVYSMGNEGSFGDVLDRRLHAYVKEIDPDRLKINQDVHRPQQTTPDRSDFDGGPTRMWPRGSFVTGRERPFVCHEYLNLCVKSDSRDEWKYSGVWLPPATRKDRLAWLARFGLDHTWGDRLQDAQNALQGVWQKRGIECARADAGCGGYLFWTIVDVVVRNRETGVYSAQGLFNPFWEEKTGGQSALAFAAFNSPMCVLADFKPSESVFAAGGRFKTDILFAHFGDEPVEDGKVDWKIVAANGSVLGGGTRDVGRQTLGPVRKIATLAVDVPQIGAPTRASFAVTVRSGDGSVAQSNAWDIWLFPKGPSREEIVAEASRRGVTIAPKDSPAAKAAIEAGGKLITIDGAKGLPNIELGWWWMGDQMGTAIADHPAFGNFPCRRYMDPLWFRLVKNTGLKLPADGIGKKDLLIVGEGGKACFSYLAQRRIGGATVLECHGLDLVSGLPEGNALLKNLVDYLSAQ